MLAAADRRAALTFRRVAGVSRPRDSCVIHSARAESMTVTLGFSVSPEVRCLRITRPQNYLVDPPDDQEAADKLRYPVRLNDVAMQALSMLDNATVRLLVSRRRLLLHLWMP
jgi:hypothetical protein